MEVAERAGGQQEGSDRYTTWRGMLSFSTACIGTNNMQKGSGDRKATMYRAIAERLFPDLFKMNAKVLSERIRAKVDE